MNSEHALASGRRHARPQLRARAALAAVALATGALGALAGPAAAASSDGFDFPLGTGESATEHRITQRYCGEATDHGPHLGVDWGAPLGTAVHAASNGTVLRTRAGADGYGNMVMLRHELPSGEHWHTVYAHLRDAPELEVGQVVARRERIGTVGSTGNSTGPHLHFAVTSSAETPNGYGAPCPGAWGTTDPIAFVSARRRLAGGDPRGAFESAASTRAGLVDVRGWAWDPDAPSTPVRIRMRVGAPETGAEWFDLGTAAEDRPDVGATAPGAGERHGFEAALRTSLRGRQPVCAYALNRPRLQGRRRRAGVRRRGARRAVRRGSPRARPRPA
jgi:murein DD-endopeptidase MepM/ murein hydrolase activator NlpD